MRKKFPFKHQIVFLFAGLALITYVSMKTFFSQDEEENLMVIANQEESRIQVYLLDGEHTVVPLSMEINPELDTGDRIKQMVEWMSTPHKPFKSVFKDGTKLKKVEVKDQTAVLTFNEKFNSYKAKDELRTLEALTWGVTQFEGIDNVSIKVGNTTLTQMPVAGTPIPSPLNRSIGINNFETTTSSLHESEPLTVFYTKQIDDKNYYVPKTKRIQDAQLTLKDSVEEVMKDISVSSGLSQPLSVERVELSGDPILDQGVLTLSLNENILAEDRAAKQDAYETLVLSLSQIDGVKHVKVMVDDVVISLHGSNEEALSVSSLSYNRIAF